MKHLLFSLSLILSILLLGATTTFAVTQGWTPPEDYRSDESIGMGFDPSVESNETETSQEDIDMDDLFGSEQVFPFPPGLGN